MPELPEVETIRRALSSEVCGKRVISVRGKSVALRRPLDIEELGAILPGRQFLEPERRPGRWKIQARGLDTLIIGRSDIDLRAVEQLQDPSQLRSVGWILGRLSEAQEPEIEPLEHIEDMLGRLHRGDWDWLTGYPDGDLAVPRPHEVMAALNRLRGVRLR